MAYADLKNDVVFRKVFGLHPEVLTGLRNDLLDRQGDRAITSLEYLPSEQAPLVMGLKLSILGVRCRDASGTTFVVEMQVLPITGLLNRVVIERSHEEVDQVRRTIEHEAEKARTEGLDEGREQGLGEGALAGRRAALRAILTARAWALDDATSHAIDACDDTATLDRWITRAATAAALADVFAAE